LIMTIASLSAIYAGPASTSAAKLVLEQAEWSVYTGTVTKQELVRWVAAAVLEEEYTAKIDCGMTGDALICPIYAYPLEADLNYRLLASYGELSERSVEIIEITELVQFRLADTASPKYPARAIVAVEWTVECLDALGELVAPPALTTDGQAIRSATVVYGTVSATYLCERHTYILNAPRRADALDNNYSAVVAAAVPGFAPVVLVVEMPPGAEAFAADPDAICGASWHGGATWPDEDDSIPEATTANLITEVDYCEQEIIREWTE
jgi:hypothetical protein